MPAELDARAKLCPLLREVRTTTAAVMTAPLLSATSPRREPVVTAAWGQTKGLVASRNTHRTKSRNGRGNHFEYDIRLLNVPRQAGCERPCEKDNPLNGRVI